MEESISFSEHLHTAFLQMTWVEIWAVITGIIYVILAAKENIWCWIFGIISSGLSVWLFFSGKLYAESILYFYYVAAGIYGWYTWGQPEGNSEVTLDAKDQSQASIQIHTWTFRQHLFAVLGASILALVFAYFLKNFTDAQIPTIDAFTTIFSFLATYMLTRKVLENWLYWVVIDFVTIFMYSYKGYYLYTLLMLVYTIIAVVGFLRWRSKYRSIQQTAGG